MIDIEKFKPGVQKEILIFLAGLVWICVGVMLIVFGYSWLSDISNLNLYIFLGIGIIAAIFVHHFGFLKIVDKNIRRILPLDGKRCLFSFISWKSYIIIIIMISMGTILRHSGVNKHYLSIIYTGIGLALILSSVRYMRIFIREIRR